MAEAVYTSHVTIEREGGPNRLAYLPAAGEAVRFGVHDAIAHHYGVDPKLYEPRPATLDYIVAAAGG